MPNSPIGHDTAHPLHATIEEDHQEAFRRIDQLEQVLHTPCSEQESLISLHFHALVQHQADHFSREEELMQTHSCPNYLRHRQEHRRVIRELQAALDHWQQYTDIDAIRTYLVEVFPNWLHRHIATMDKVALPYSKVL